MTVGIQGVTSKENCYKNEGLGTLCEIWANWWAEIILEYIKN